MGALRHIGMLTRYTQWANQRIDQALEPVAEPEQKVPCPGRPQGMAGPTEQDLKENVAFRFVDGGEGCLSRGDMLLHMVNHKIYHRGNVADMLYRLWLKPPQPGPAGLAAGSAAARFMALPGTAGSPLLRQAASASTLRALRLSSPIVAA